MVNNSAEYNEQFKKNMLSVYDWNVVARQGREVFTQEEVDKQYLFCFEELRETLAAIASKDEKETKDGVADVFVTVSFLCVLQFGKEFLDVLEDNKYDAFERLEEFRAEYSKYDELGNFWIKTNSTLKMMELLGRVESGTEFVRFMHLFFVLGYDIFGDIECVMESNWTKFPTVDRISDPEAECRWIEENRKQEGVRFTNHEGRYIFHNSFGKIVKPSTFREPTL